MPFQELIRILQAAIGPVILISGSGLLLLSMNNRIVHVIDRARKLIDAIQHAPPAERGILLAQVTILIRRARLLRTAIGLATSSVLMVALLVILLFLASLLQIELAQFGAALFVASMLSLICSLGFFLADVQASLRALKLELRTIAETAQNQADSPPKAQGAQ